MLSEFRQDLLIVLFLRAKYKDLEVLREEAHSGKGLRSLWMG